MIGAISAGITAGVADGVAHKAMAGEQEAKEWITEYFGAEGTTSERLAELDKKLIKISNKLCMTTVCPGDPWRFADDKKLMGYVYKNGFDDIFYNPVLKYQIINFAEALVHEAAHLAITRDHVKIDGKIVYGNKKSKRLAKESTSKAFESPSNYACAMFPFAGHC